MYMHMGSDDGHQIERIDSVDDVFIVAKRLIRWMRQRSRVERFLSRVAPEDRTIRLLQVGLGNLSPQELDKHISNSADLSEMVGDSWLAGWGSDPFHCGGCAIPYQELVGQVIEFATSTKPSEELATELAKYDHMSLDEVLKLRCLPFPFHVDPIIDYLAKKQSSHAGRVLNQLRYERDSYRAERFARSGDSS